MNILSPSFLSDRIRRRAAAHRPCLAVFNYHQVSPSFDPRLHGRATWTALDAFQREIARLRRRMPVIPLQEGVSILKKGELDRDYAALTFDDGDVSLEQHVAPWLADQGIPATLFVNTAYIGTKRANWHTTATYFRHCTDPALQDKWTSRHEETSQRLRRCTEADVYRAGRAAVEALAAAIPENDRVHVSWNFLRSLDSRLFRVGPHGHEHERYALMSPEWREQDLRENERLLAVLPSYIPYFAMPFGRPYDWDADTLRLCEDMTLEILFADGGVNRGQSPGIRRIPADGRPLLRLLRQNRGKG